MLWTIFALSVVFSVAAIFAIFNVLNYLEFSHADGIMLISTMPVLAVFSVCVVTVHYKLDDTHLRLNIAFWDVLGGKIRVENICNIVYTDGKMYISYFWKGYDPTISQIAVDPKNFDKLRDALMSKNKRIVFFDDDKAIEEQN